MVWVWYGLAFAVVGAFAVGVWRASKRGMKK